MALCKNDLNYLIISGAPSKEELSLAWLQVINDYLEQKEINILDTEYYSLSRDVLRLHSHLYYLQMSIDLLTLQYSDVLAKTIRNLGYDFNPDSKEPIAYMPLLKEVSKQARTKYVELQQLQKQLQPIIEEQEAYIPSYTAFEKKLTVIEEMQHVSYDFRTLTVSKFIALEQKLEAKIEALAVQSQ